MRQEKPKRETIQALRQRRMLAEAARQPAYVPPAPDYHLMEIERAREAMLITGAENEAMRRNLSLRAQLKRLRDANPEGIQ
jgi:hypothetical protein